ncbi:hypothetical protein PISMIDRAFT_672931 [Pisolithus microcarpus 441]|uniref:Histone chaperone domain-containing protein n=1 Tax=Pisolithus microcarpus 441 TaxID=765257 RepID=A0A0D0A2S1_9AGAM|nr:hypothetical protein BKA83DRAFT_672931 [Pisolithus microcarpus]KIK28747.1 hypothetical protein PISMIDRAFT_672931 [Pisolithus microcarpus 441]
MSEEEVTYNPNADPTVDEAEYRPPADPDDDIPVGARGVTNEPTNVDADREDFETAQSETTGSIPRREVKDVLSETSAEERGASGTRGKRVDYAAREAALDRGQY